MDYQVERKFPGHAWHKAESFATPQAALRSMFTENRKQPKASVRVIYKGETISSVEPLRLSPLARLFGHKWQG